MNRNPGTPPQISPNIYRRNDEILTAEPESCGPESKTFGKFIAVQFAAAREVYLAISE